MIKEHIIIEIKAANGIFRRSVTNAKGELLYEETGKKWENLNQQLTDFIDWSFGKEKPSNISDFAEWMKKEVLRKDDNLKEAIGRIACNAINQRLLDGLIDNHL